MAAKKITLSLYLEPHQKSKIDKIALRLGVSWQVVVRWLIESLDEDVFLASFPIDRKNILEKEQPEE